MGEGSRTCYRRAGCEDARSIDLSCAMVRQRVKELPSNSSNLPPLDKLVSCIALCRIAMLSRGPGRVEGSQSTRAAMLGGDVSLFAICV